MAGDHTEMTEPGVAESLSETMRSRLRAAILAPLQAMRLRYLPLLMVYFAYGAMGLVAVADSFWVKKALTLSASDLAQLGVWLTLPWTVKMVFGELVDTVAILGSQRRIYVFAGAGLIAASLLILSGTASGAITFASPDKLYIVASLMSVTGIVLQDVVADAMSTEVVERINPDGSPRPQSEIDHDLGMVQVLGRLALSLGIFSTAGLAGFLAQTLPYATVFLIGLVVPAISISGALLVRLESSESRPTDWRILGGGLAFGLAVVVLSLLDVPFAQEIVFLLSLGVIVGMLERVTRDIDAETRRRILYAALVIFAFRAVPGVGEGFRWFEIDVLGFDEAFFGTLAQIGAGIGLVATWLLSDSITRQPVARVLLWLTLLGGLLAIPSLALVLRLDLWTEATFGFGARAIALVDAAAASPLAQLSMIPLLMLTAIYAPPRHRAIWFALMASFMNLALVAGQLQTKYLNQMFTVGRGAYDELAMLFVVVVAIGLAVPLTAIVSLGRQVRSSEA
jgi:MFS family permease